VEMAEEECDVEGGRGRRRVRKMWLKGTPKTSTTTETHMKASSGGPASVTRMTESIPDDGRSDQPEEPCEKPYTKGLLPSANGSCIHH